MAARARTSPTPRRARRRWTSMLDTTAVAIPQVMMMALVLFATAQTPAPDSQPADQPPTVVVMER